jgi:UDP-N-acetylglucosamine transferase subunit ALG13
MQYDKDINSPKAELFLEVEKFVMKQIGKDVKKKFSENITSYITKDGMYCYLKLKDDYLHIGWGRGAKIDDKYGLLIGDGKIVRGQKVYKLDKSTKDAIKYYIEDTRAILFEHTELKMMKKALQSL